MYQPITPGLSWSVLWSWQQSSILIMAVDQLCLYFILWTLVLILWLRQQNALNICYQRAQWDKSNISNSLQRVFFFFVMKRIEYQAAWWFMNAQYYALQAQTKLRQCVVSFDPISTWTRLEMFLLHAITTKSMKYIQMTVKFIKRHNLTHITMFMCVLYPANI